MMERKERLIKNHPEAKLERTIPGSNVGKGFKAEAIVFRKLKDLGFNVSYPLWHSPYDLIVGKLKIEVKNAGKTFKSFRNNTSYYRGHLTLNELKTADFVIVYISPTKDFYIVPTTRLKSTSIYIRSTENNTNGKYQKNTNYKEYKDAWHLLKHDGHNASTLKWRF